MIPQNYRLHPSGTEQSAPNISLKGASSLNVEYPCSSFIIRFGKTKDSVSMLASWNKDSPFCTRKAERYTSVCIFSGRSSATYVMTIPPML
jgi:hypothetical protein